MTFFTESKPTARKRHICASCRRIIEPGEVYRRGAGMDGGTAWTWKECLHCAALILRINDLVDDDGEGYSWESFADYARGDYGFETVADLRAAAGWRMQWRTRRGTLLPVPERKARRHVDTF